MTSKLHCMEAPGRSLRRQGLPGGRLQRQSGVALFIALVILLIITVLGISGLQTTTLEERMAAGARDRDLAFQAAEAALAEGEAFIETLGPGSLAQFQLNANGLFVAPQTASTPDRWVSVDWEGDATIPTVGTSIDGVVAQPRYIIEHVTTLVAAEDSLNISNLGAPVGTPTEIFRVTSRAQGGTARAVVMLQATYGKIL